MGAHSSNTANTWKTSRLTISFCVHGLDCMYKEGCDADTSHTDWPIPTRHTGSVAITSMHVSYVMVSHLSSWNMPIAPNRDSHLALKPTGTIWFMLSCWCHDMDQPTFLLWHESQALLRLFAMPTRRAGLSVGTLAM